MRCPQDAGWAPVGEGTCDPHRGIAYAVEGKITRCTPVTLYFNPASQIVGVGVTVFGDVNKTLIDAGYFEFTGKQQQGLKSRAWWS